MTPTMPDCVTVWWSELLSTKKPAQSTKIISLVKNNFHIWTQGSDFVLHHYKILLQSNMVLFWPLYTTLALLQGIKGIEQEWGAHLRFSEEQGKYIKTTYLIIVTSVINWKTGGFWLGQERKLPKTNIQPYFKYLRLHCFSTFIRATSEICKLLLITSLC